MHFGTEDVSLWAWDIWNVRHFNIWYWARDKVMDWITISAPNTADPASMDINDVYAWSYLELVLTKVWIDAAVASWTYLFFDTQLSNLAGISTKIWYKETIDANNIRVYIRWTNKAGTTPTIWEQVSVYKTYWPVPIVADKTWVYMLPLDGVNPVSATKIYEASSGDSIVDITEYNGVIFIMTKRYIFFSQTLSGSNTNIYPLDFLDNVNWWERIIPFGKMMILFWTRNAVIRPINSTDANLGYVYVDLNYEYKLYSKYSVLSYVWALYVLQDNWYFVTLDINSVTNTDYNVKINIIHQKWMLDKLSWDVYIRHYDKSILLLEQQSWNTNVFKYDTEYLFWNIHEYNRNVYWVEDKAFWEELWTLWYNKDVEQSINWSIWWTDINIMKMFYYVKFVVWYRDDELLDYLLDVTTYIWWIKETITHKLNNYTINREINKNISLWNWVMWWESDTLWKIFSFTESVARSWDLFNITLRSNKNELIYWWSICWISNYAPFVTTMWNKH